jgi:hypothetical protein
MLALVHFLLPVLVIGFDNVYLPMAGYEFSWTADVSNNKLSVQLKLTPGTGQTSGWVGFGIAGGGGGMLGADMFTAYSTGASSCDIQDRMAVDKVLPSLDISSEGFADWNLTSCSLVGSVFTVAADRAFETFDVRDRAFVGGPMNLVFAWGQTVPTNPNTLTFHDGGHGPRTLSLWGEVVAPFNVSELESDYDTQLIAMTDIPVGNATTYICQGFNVTQKNNNLTQAIVFEPIVPSSSEPFVHHMVLHTCSAPASSIPFSCVTMPSGCGSILYAWGKGGGPFVLPSITGVQIGSVGRTYVVLQVHYNNPANVTDIIDNSGVNIYRTNQIRATQAGLFAFGAVNFTLLPQIPEFSISGACPASVTNNAFPVSGVTAYSSFMHAHQRGRRIWTEVWRNGVLVATLGNNQNYDFNLQKVVALAPFVTLQKNDTLNTYCTYDTTQDSQNVTHGEKTSNEMCLNFVAYYPLIGANPLLACGPVSPSNPGSNPDSTMCSVLPGEPPAAYNVTGWTTANVQFKTGGSATCKSGFTGTAVLGCAGYGAPYTFSGCVRVRNTQSLTHSPTSPTTPAPTTPQQPSLNPAVRATLPCVLILSLAILW